MFISSRIAGTIKRFEQGVSKLIHEFGNSYTEFLGWEFHKNITISLYIYSHPQTDCFVLSELFSVARHVGRSKPGSKPIQLYVRLNLRPLGRQAGHVG